MPENSSLTVLQDQLDTLGRAMRAIAETQDTHTKMLRVLLEAAAGPPDDGDQLVDLLARILAAVEAQTVALDGVRQAVAGPRSRG